MQFIERIIEKIRDAGVTFDPAVQVAPECILWPDKDRQWEKAIQIFLEKMPELLILGDYLPEKRTGPAIWLRCVIPNKTCDLELPKDRKPVIYLPGVSRQDLRDVENCPENLKPLVELQFRGIIWSQGNKDWTVLAFLKANPGGFTLDIVDNAETKPAMLRALKPLLHTDIESLKDKSLDKEFFNNLLACDYTRYMLQWLNQGDTFKSSIDNDEWQAFIETCKSKLSFNPDEEGPLSAATKLASGVGSWDPIWKRFCEAPNRYPNIPELIRKCKPPKSILWQNPGQNEYDRWPQYNQEQEDSLRKELKALDGLTPHKARDKVNELEKDHGPRRNLVWAELGKTPLAQALKHLSILSNITANRLNSLTAGTAEDLSTIYQKCGWQADEAMIQALDSVENQEDLEAIKTAIIAIYKPWAEESARYLQKITYEKGYPGYDVSNHKTPQYEKGECVLFVDGLRFDAAKRLAKMLNDQGYKIEENPVWAALPSVTATGKPAVTPVRNKIKGGEANTDFEPNVAETGLSLKGGYYLKKLLTDSGWEIVEPPYEGKPESNAWCESFGNIDNEGHARGWKLAKHLDEILREIQDQVIQLIKANWKKVHIVTDHGWLLLPDGLPKSELPSAQTLTKWGRCAAIKPGASTKEQLYPWYWNPTQHFALADGISCFRSGLEYDHGGISLQECLTLHLIISPGAHASHIAPQITNKNWKGLRCNVTVDGVFEDLCLDIRTQPANPSSSVINEAKQLKSNGTTSLLVENMDIEGTAAMIVLINKKGELVAQTNTIIGEQ